ncbi:protein kinase [Rhodopirellula sp.]|nr:protein kinase [bacterium]MDB4476788.1 protein kinase [Rhodopirellula sp.]
MHGSICCIVKKFVDTNHGPEAWDAILEQAGHKGLVLSPIGTYPDEAVFALLGAGCELLQVELDDLLRTVGRFAGPELIGFANTMLHPEWKTFELLANVESLIHRTIRMQNPTAQPANIQAFRLSENEAHVVYSSRRGLCTLAHGIIEGVADFYKENITIREVTCAKQGHPFCTFEAKRVVVQDEITEGKSIVIEPTVTSESFQETFVASDSVGDSSAASNSSSFDWFPANAAASREGSGIRGSQKNVIPFPKRLGRYAIQEIIGVGGMGVVYRGTDDVLNRVVAIKTLKSVKIGRELADPFIEEARAMARLSHENVVRVYDVGEIDGRPFFVMEYLTGQALSKRIRQGQVSLQLGAELFKKILQGVNAVHKIGLVHRDIKPDNIMLSLDSRKCHLLDFGLADELCVKRDVSKRLSGTPGFIAPERLRGYPADYKSDFFSLGCVAYEIFSGRRAFDSDSTQAVISSMQRFEPRESDWRDTPDELRKLIVSMMHIDASERMTDYEEIDNVLDAMLIQLSK